MPLNHCVHRPVLKTTAVEIADGTTTADMRAALHAALDRLLDESAGTTGTIAGAKKSVQVGLEQGSGSVAFATKAGELVFDAAKVAQADTVFDGKKAATGVEEVLCCVLLDRLGTGTRLSVRELMRLTGYAMGTIKSAMGQVRMRCDALGTLAIAGSESAGWSMHVVQQPVAAAAQDAFVVQRRYVRGEKVKPELRFGKTIGETIALWRRELGGFPEKRADVAVSAALLEQMRTEDAPAHTLFTLAQRIGITTTATVRKSVAKVETNTANATLGLRLRRGTTKVSSMEMETMWLEAQTPA